MAEQIYCYIDGDKDWAPWTPPADRDIDRRMEVETQREDVSRFRWFWSRNYEIRIQIRRLNMHKTFYS